MKKMVANITYEDGTTEIFYLSAKEKPLYLEDASQLDSSTLKTIKLFPIGKAKYRGDFPGGKIMFDRALLESMKKNFDELKKNAPGFQLQINYHHLGGIDLSTGSPLENTVAAGWIEALEIRDDGMYAHTEWTPRATDFIKNGEFKFISPEFSLEYDNRDTGKPQGPTLLGAALTNTPFLKELPRVAASDNGKVQEMKELTQMLGLPEGATYEEVVLKVKSLLEEIAGAKGAAKEEEKKMSETSEKLSKLSEANKALTDAQKSLSDKVAKLEAEKLETQVSIYLAEKVREGRVAPAQVDGFKKLALTAGIDAIKPICDSAQVVKMGELGTTGAGVPENKAEATKKLTEIAATLQEKHKLSATDAMRRAVRENRELAGKTTATN